MDIHLHDKTCTSEERSAWTETIESKGSGMIAFWHRLYQGRQVLHIVLYMYIMYVCEGAFNKQHCFRVGLMTALDSSSSTSFGYNHCPNIITHQLPGQEKKY